VVARGSFRVDVRDNAEPNCMFRTVCSIQLSLAKARTEFLKTSRDLLYDVSLGRLALDIASDLLPSSDSALIAFGTHSLFQ